MQTARRSGANAVVTNYQLVDPLYIDEIQRRGLSLWVWTVDDPQTMETLLDLGIDGIITNHPAVLGKVLKGRR